MRIVDNDLNWEFQEDNLDQQVLPLIPDDITGQLSLQIAEEEAKRIYNPRGASFFDLIAEEMLNAIPEVPEGSDSNIDQLRIKLNVQVVVFIEGTEVDSTLEKPEFQIVFN